MYKVWVLIYDWYYNGFIDLMEFNYTIKLGKFIKLTNVK
jgi:hypothetical protein